MYPCMSVDFKLPDAKIRFQLYPLDIVDIYILSSCKSELVGMYIFFKKYLRMICDCFLQFSVI